MKILPVNNFGMLKAQKPSAPSFCRKWEEHKSWGATLDKDTVNFKFYTFPNVQGVYAEVANESKNKIQEQDNLKVERDGASNITSISSKDGSSQIIKLEKNGDFYQKTNVEGLKAGQQYRYIVVGANGNIETVKDPYSKEQRGILSWSTIHNPDNYKWSKNEADWQKGKDPRRISRRKDAGLSSVGSLRIMEINIPTITPEGTFKAAQSVIKDVAKKGLANAIEIMPVENCNSKQWGYDGVDKFAINERLGTSEDLKALIDCAHQNGLNVIMDMVPNHIGTDGNTLGKAGPYEGEGNGFGPKGNYEGEGGRYVRDWIANAALHWVDEYHVDGLRLDMTKPHYMGSDFTLKQINAEMNHHFPDTFMIAEDGRGEYEGRDRVLTPIVPEVDHEKYIETHIDDRVGTGAFPEKIGFDADWDFDFVHALEEMLENPDNFNISWFNGALMASQNRVSYPISHDEQGNLDGTGGVTKLACVKLNLFNKIREQNNAKRGQKAAAATQYLLELYATGQMEKMSQEQMQKDLAEKFGLDGVVTKEEVKGAYDWAVNRVKLGMGVVYTFPGPKMFFQGYEKASLDYFKFFRDFSSGPEDYMIDEKGYETSTEKALKDSLPNRIKYSNTAKDTMGKVEQYSIDLNKLVAQNPALQEGEIMERSTVLHEGEAKVQATHSKKDDNEVFSIKNFSHISYNNDSQYGIVFPQGKWVEVINSDDTKYAGEGLYINKDAVIESDGQSAKEINLGSSDVSVWKKVD